MGVPYAEVIGDPVEHSKSPAIHKYWLEQLGIKGDYRVTRVTADELSGYFEARRADPDWRGCNVTMPHKRAVESLLDRLDPSSEWAESTNCVYWDGKELWGCNTDSSGVGAAIFDAPVHQNSVVVIGAGAAARTALWVLAREEPAELRVVARDPDRALAALEDLRPAGRCFEMSEVEAAFSGAAVVINASPLGMRGFGTMSRTLLAAIRHTRIDAVVMDMVYGPLETPFLAAAREFGRRSKDGLVMLVGQAQDSFGHFFDGDAPLASWEDAALRQRLTS
jgi:shikimate dehydrogenase